MDLHHPAVLRWDPALIDALATARRVVTFDNAGVGGSTGTTPGTIEQMARDAIAFLAAWGFLPRCSYLLAGPIPHARVKIYTDSAHRFLFQHHAEFAADVQAFLTGAG